MAKAISRDELKGRLERGDKPRLVNVLSADSFESAHVPGSINVPVGEIEQHADHWDKDEPVVVYCASFDCMASVRAAAKLEALGFTNVMEFEGGTSDWIDGGYPVETGKYAA